MRIFIPIILVVVAAVIATGFFLIGSPKEQRLLRFDEQRVQALQVLQGEILNYYQVTRHLPEKLSDIVDPTRNISIPQDPETGAEYNYQVKSSEDFELCADFNRPSPDVFVSGSRTPYGYSDESWIHPAGHYCFDRPFKKEFYPPNPASPIVK